MRRSGVRVPWVAPSGCSAVRLARVVRDDEVGGSNPLTPTTSVLSACPNPSWQVKTTTRGMRPPSQMPLSAKMRTLFLILLLFPAALSAQRDSLTEYIYTVITLDSVTVSATREGLDLRDFIKLVQEDLSFYNAFRKLRLSPHRSDVHMSFSDKRGRPKADYFVRTRQRNEGLCRSMEVEEEKVSGPFFSRKGSYKYYTAELYASIFFTRDTACLPRQSEAWPAQNSQKLSGTAKHIEELKKVFFATGQAADVPLTGNKMAIFSEKMVDRYAYEIQGDTLSGHPCYRFSIRAKPDLPTSKTVIKKLDIWFERGNLQVLRRQFHLYARAFLYDFDVHFDILLQQQGLHYLPQHISYQGWWKVPTQKIERGKVEVRFYDFFK